MRDQQTGGKQVAGKQLGRGDAPQSWWAERWLAVIESFTWDKRLQRGRSYARNGNVHTIRITPGKITAKVEGNRYSPYSVRLEVPVLSSDEWDAALQELAKEALFAVQLLAGEMPANIEEVFERASISLIPQSDAEFDMRCTCPDWVEPCKHQAAVFYALADAFTADPFLLFQLRGMKTDKLVRRLRQLRAAEAKKAERSRAHSANSSGKEGKRRARMGRRGATEHQLQARTELGGEAAGAEAEAVSRKDPALLGAPVAMPPGTSVAMPLETDLERFWHLTHHDAFPVRIEPPSVPHVVLRRLGEPDFWKERHSFTELMQEAYDVVSRRAFDWAMQAGADGLSSSEAHRVDEAAGDPLGVDAETARETAAARDGNDT